MDGRTLPFIIPALKIKDAPDNSFYQIELVIE